MIDKLSKQWETLTVMDDSPHGSTYYKSAASHQQQVRPICLPQQQGQALMQRWQYIMRRQTGGDLGQENKGATWKAQMVRQPCYPPCASCMAGKISINAYAAWHVVWCNSRLAWNNDKPWGYLVQNNLLLLEPKRRHCSKVLHHNAWDWAVLCITGYKW